MTTTILILAIDDAGRTRVYNPSLSVRETLHKMAPFMRAIESVRSGDDRGHYDVFEVAGVSIDVVRMPEAKHGE